MIMDMKQRKANQQQEAQEITTTKRSTQSLRQRLGMDETDKKEEVACYELGYN